MFSTRDGRAVEIRPAQLADAGGVNRLVRAIAAEGAYLTLEPDEVWDLAVACEAIARLDLARDCWLVVAAGAEIVGQATAFRGERSRTRHTATVGLGLAPAFRGQGIGQLLMQTLEEWARTAGIRKLQLSVLATNHVARALYGRLGYGVEGVRVRQYLVQGEYVDEVLMAKWLG